MEESGHTAQEAMAMAVMNAENVNFWVFPTQFPLLPYR